MFAFESIRSLGFNAWAVLVSATLAFVTGGAWYSLLFARPWARAHGMSASQFEEFQAQRAADFVGTFATYLVMATVFSFCLRAVGAETVVAGLLAGAVVWVGLVAASGLTLNLFSKAPIQAWWIDSSHQLVYLLLMGAVLARWR